MSSTKTRSASGTGTAPAKPVKAVVVDVAKHRAVISRYATTRALHDAHIVTFEKAGIVAKIASFGTLDGLKHLDIDMTLYQKSKAEQITILKTKVSELLGLGGQGVPAYLNFVATLEAKTRQLQLAMEELRKAVMKHNQGEGELAAAWGKAYSVVKAGADVTVSTVAVFVPVGGSAISLGYSAATEGIAFASDPGSADAFAFKGAGTELAFMAAEKASARTLTQFGQQVLLGVPNVVISALFAADELQDNWKKFE